MGTVKSRRARTYRLGRRQAGADETRARLVAAARRVLMSPSGPSDLGLETVARRAGVTRLTVYHQFGSKTGLLEAVYDDMARRGRIAESLAAAFRQTDALACLDAAVAAFVSFWARERPAIRRLRAMAALDRQFKGATERDERRLAAMHTVVHRVAEQRGQPLGDIPSKAKALSMLTSFEAFDALAGRETPIDQVLAMLRALCRAVLAQP